MVEAGLGGKHIRAAPHLSVIDMDLGRPAEPTEIREEVENFLAKYPGSREEGGHSVADPISYWYGNKLPRYLWKEGWGPQLRKAGFNEDRFMRTVGAHRVGFFRWIDGEVPWDKLLDLILASVLKTSNTLQAKAST